MTNELTVTNSDLSFMPVMDISIALERRNQIVKFVKAIMVENTDFGVIPGTDKPTLLKPGAEKLATFFGLTKRFQIIERVEDWTGKDHAGEQFFYYLYRCVLYRGDLLIAEADGSCSSFDGKYRWRKAERICPECGQANIRKSRQGGGWYCWQKTGGCGATFKAGDSAIESQEVGRILNPDIADQVNTIQKMSQKRALIAATLLAVNASEFFTQDMEDYIDAEFTAKEAPATPLEPKPEQSANAPSTGSGQAKTNGNGGLPPESGAGGHTDKPYKFPSTAAKKFYEAVQAATNNFYSDPPALLEVIDNWFNFGSEDLVKEKLSMAVDHARMSRETKQVEVETQVTQDEIQF